MLDFFRKYQKYIFLFTTVVIVVSFVFFGAAQVISPNFFGGGGPEKRSYLAQMKEFLDTEQWMISRRVFAANFLNDGVISKEILESSIGDQLAVAFPERFQNDFKEKLEKEKVYRPYVHSANPSLSAESLWSIFAPDIPQKLKLHVEGQGEFSSRSALFLAQKNFPPAFLSQILRYQEQQNNQYDPRLSKDDIYLFGHRTLTDWFGDGFVQMCAKVIIQTADLARKQGYKVSQEELLAELILQSQEIYKALKSKVELPVQDGYGLFQLYLSQIGMSEQIALQIWEDITLFRRLMHSVGDAALNDVLGITHFYEYAYESALVELLQMPKELRLSSQEELKKLETYFALCGERRKSVLDIPLNFAPLNVVEAQAPELVGKRYKIEFATLSKNALQAKVSMKEIVEWECDAQNWALLQSHFPSLASKSASFEALESLSEKERKLVDSFTAKQIAEQHEEWVSIALSERALQEKELFLSAKGDAPFAGINDMSALMVVLDDAEETSLYTQDNENFFHFVVKERESDKTILTFREAVDLKILDNLFARAQADVLLAACVEATPDQFKDKAHAYRFAPYIAKHKENSPEGTLAKQFPILKLHKSITRSERSFISIDEALALRPGSFTDVKVDPTEGAFAFRFIEKKTDKTIPLDMMVKSQELLSKEARSCYFEKLLPKLNLS